MSLPVLNFLVQEAAQTAAILGLEDVKEKLDEAGALLDQQAAAGEEEATA